MGSDQTGSGQIQAGTNAYTNLANEGNEMFSQVFPFLQKMMPMLMQTLQGKNTSLTEAARAPVIGQTQQEIGTMQNNAGASANPNAAAMQMSQNGAQAAGLAGDANLQSVMQQLSGLITSGQNFSGTALSNSGSGLANLGTTLSAQNQNMWSNIFSGIGNVAGMAMGVPGLGGSPAPASGEQPSTPSAFNASEEGQAYNSYSNTPGMGSNDTMFSPSGITPSYNSSGGSTPISATGIVPPQLP